MKSFKLPKRTPVKRNRYFKKSGVFTEEVEQMKLFQWASYQKFGKLLFAIPNGGVRDWTTAKSLKAQGVKAGIPDTLLAMSRGGYNGFFQELKAMDVEKASDLQNDYMRLLQEQGYLCKVTQGWEAAARNICTYLSINPRDTGLQ
jgi:hypothetical protein